MPVINAAASHGAVGRNDASENDTFNGGDMDTRLMHLSQVVKSAGLASSLASPLKSELFSGKYEAKLAKQVGITQFGVNHVTLEPGAASALRHWHQAEDEFAYVLSGHPTLIDDNGEHELSPGSFAGFRAG